MAALDMSAIMDSPEFWRSVFFAIATITAVCAALWAADYFGNKRWPE